MKYRPEIDGLRAIAVLAVLFYHAGFSLFPGGFLGVDIFFVISGYLITSIISNEINDNSFSLIRFYERRTRRIFPALFFISIVSIPPALLWMTPLEIKAFFHSLIATTLFSSNIYFWTQESYFGVSAELKPMLHTWSLAVEEQFYLFFPLGMLLLRKVNRKTTFVILGCTSIASLLLAEYGSRTHPSANFYLLPTRLWELGAGALLAIANPTIGPSKKKWSTMLSLIGLCMIIRPILFYDDLMPHPGFITLEPIIGTVLVIMTTKKATILRNVLGCKLMIGIGLISYSTYLWHQPLFAYYRLNFGTISLTYSVILIIITLTLAFVSWKYIEAPFRKKSVFSRKQVFYMAGISSCSLIIISIPASLYQGYDEKYTATEKTLLKFLSYNKTHKDPFMLNQKQDIEDLDPHAISSEASIFIWGDSHGASLAQGFRQRTKSLTQLTAASCLPLIDYNVTQYPRCDSFNQFVLTKIEEQKPSIIILSGHWFNLSQQKGVLQTHLSKTINEIKYRSPNSTIILVGSLPQWLPSLPQIMISNRVNLESEAYIRTPLFKIIDEVDSVLREVAKINGITFFSVLDSFCENGKCLSSVRNRDTYEPFAWDYGHLTHTAGKKIAEQMMKEIPVFSDAD